MLFERSPVGGYGSVRVKGLTRARPAGAVLATAGVVSAAALSAVIGPVTTASAATGPEMQVHPLAMDTVGGGSESGLINVDLVLRAGEVPPFLGGLVTGRRLA